MAVPSSRPLEAFDACRSDLIALAYRMLGDFARAEDMVQETWLRWQDHDAGVDSPRAFLITIVTRLCLNELGSARARREETRADRLPEPIDLDHSGISHTERLEQISMAFLVMLQRLTPAERAVLLLHDVFDFDHREVATLIGSNASACRKQLERARRSIANEKRMSTTSPDEHRRLLRVFLDASSAGDVKTLIEILANDATMITDGGIDGRAVGRQRNIPRPLHGAARVAAFVAATTVQNGSALRAEERDLNGQPAIVFWNGEQPFAALLLAVCDGKVQRVFFHADASRLRVASKRAARSD